LASVWLEGCGSGGANTVTVTMSQESATLVTTQVLNLTATVAGATNLNVNWTCTFTTTTTTTASNGTTSSTTSSAAPCTAATGVLTNIQDTTVTYTAPTKITTPPPTSTTIVSPPTVTITATAQADTKKTDTCVVTLDSGITVTINPANAAVPTSQNFQFTASLTNDTIPNDVTWQLTQEPLSTTTLAELTTCSPTCGSISKNGLYTAPTAVPTANTPTSITTTTPQSLSVIAVSVVDATKIGFSTVTVVPTGVISFTGISPSVAPLGGVLQDIYLAATNVNSLTSIFYDGTALPSSQVLVVSPPVAGSTPTGARARLLPAQLATAGTHVIGICNPPIGQSTCSPNSSGGPFNITVAAQRPVVVSSQPNSLPQTAAAAPSGGALTIDGGYFGSPNAPLVSVLFGGNHINIAEPTSRQLSLTMPALPTPGLYPISVTNNSASPTTAVTNVAVFPDYGPGGVNTPAGVTNLISLAAGSGGATATPSAIAIDDVLEVAVVAEAGTNSVEYINLNSGNPTLISGRVPVGNVPTGVAVDDVLHIAAVVNYVDRTVELLSIPAPGQTPSATSLGTISLSALIPTSAPTTPPTPPPFPYSIGIDPFSHTAVIAYANTNIGFIADINPANKANTSECLLAGQHPPCVTSSVTLNTGQYPQVALEPRVHLAYVTPGGAGNLSVVDLTHKSASIGIASATRAANIVTISTVAPHNISPANPGTVLISGVSTANSNFNGTFSGITVIDANDFEYSQTAIDDTVTGGTVASPVGEASYGIAYLTYSISQTEQGVAINPITRAAMIADPNATAAQIDFIDTLDQTVSSLSLIQGAVLGSTTNTGAEGEIGDANVAFQPYTNTAVLFNPTRNEISLIDPSRLQRIAIVPAAPSGVTTNGNGSVNVPNGSSQPTPLPIPGALAVDAANNVALAVNSGSNNISVLYLGNAASPNAIKPVHIESVMVTSAGIPNSILPQAVLTTNSTPLAGGATSITITGTGFQSGSGVQVRLDGTPLTSVTVVNNSEITATIPTSFLTVPRHYALDVVVGGVGSNATDFSVIQAVDLTPACAAGSTPQPGAVAIDTTRNIAAVSNFGCGSISLVDLTPGASTPLKSTISVGSSPEGIDVIPRLGYAVVANNGSGTASIVNMDTATLVSSPGTGTNPSGVAIDQYSGLAIVANTGSNSITAIDLTSITSSTTTPTVNTLGIDQQPIAIAIDPNRAACASTSTTGVGVAVITALELGTGTGTGALDTVDISTNTPVTCTTVAAASTTATPTGIVFDPAGQPTTTTSTTSTSASGPGISPGVFYATGSQGNVIYVFDPDTGTATPVNVGINPTSLAVNPNTGTLLTVNSLSNTISVLDTQSLKTQATMSIGGSTQFAAAIHPLTNMAVITDQVNNRLLIVPLPN
jgi:DNA-binding beta-propeller fold protein YncE